MLINRQEERVQTVDFSQFLVKIPDNMLVCKEKFPIVTLSQLCYTVQDDKRYFCQKEKENV